MQQWEYRTTTLHPVTGFASIKGWKLKEINEQQLSNWQVEEHTSIDAFCNQMGLRGWELVSTINGAYRGLIPCFKRPRE